MTCRSMCATVNRYCRARMLLHHAAQGPMWLVRLTTIRMRCLLVCALHGPRPQECGLQTSGWGWREGRLLATAVNPQHTPFAPSSNRPNAQQTGLSHNIGFDPG
jgi:hypothetical protein